MPAMLDAQNAPAAPPAPIRREDYRAPDWLVPEIALDFDLGAERTIVRARLTVERNGASGAPLRLDAEKLEIRRVLVDGAEADWTCERDILEIAVPGARAVVETEVGISPRANSQLMGLYESGGILCTQCEAEGFRRITPFPDRPDVLSRYRVRMTADKALHPVLLSNGDPVGAGDLEGGRHWAEWHDPFPKPCYLFALVAGDLVANRASFVTRSGRTVSLGIYVREGDLARTEHAMDALKTAMKWDEETYGASTTSTCSTSSRSPISTSARWRIRASTSSIRAISSPIPKPRPTPITTPSPESSPTNISTIGPATG
jgi:aminopeptidase N